MSQCVRLDVSFSSFQGFAFFPLFCFFTWIWFVLQEVKRHAFACVCVCVCCLQHTHSLDQIFLACSYLFWATERCQSKTSKKGKEVICLCLRVSICGDFNPLRTNHLWTYENRLHIWRILACLSRFSFFLCVFILLVLQSEESYDFPTRSIACRGGD